MSGEIESVAIISHKGFADKLKAKMSGIYRVTYVSPEEVNENPPRWLKPGKLLVLAELPELIHCNNLLAQKLAALGVPFAPMGFSKSPYLKEICDQFEAPFVVTEDLGFSGLINHLQDFYNGTIAEQSGNTQNLEFNGDELLNPAEYKVLYWICKDFSTKEIAHLLGKSPRTVENIRARLMNRLQVNGVAGLVKWAYDNNIIYPILGRRFYNRFFD